MTLSSLRTVSTVLVLWFAGLGAAAQFAKIAVPFSFLRSLYPEAGADLGWLLSLISLFGVVFGMTAGVLIAGLGCGRLLVTALILGAAVSFWQATLPPLPWMLASRLIEGISHLVIVVAAPTLMAQVSGKRFRGVAMTLWSTFFGVSFAVVAWIGLPAVRVHGLSDLFLAHGVFMLLVAGVLILDLASLNASIPGSHAELRVATILRQHVDAYRSPFISAPAIGWFFYTLTFVALLAILPDFLSEQSRGQVAASMPLASIAVGLFVVSPLLAVFSAVTIVIIGFAAAGSALSLFWTDLPLSHACILLFAILGMVQAASFAAVPELNAAFRARALSHGAMAQMGNLGNTLGTPVLLMVQSHSGLNGLLLAVLALYSAGCTAHLLLARARR